MEMGVTLHVPRRRPRPLELVVRWQGPQTARGLRAALAAHLGQPVGSVLVAGRLLADDAVVGVPPLVDGASLAVVPSSSPAPPPNVPVAALELVVVGGPDAGRSRVLTPPGFDVGRHPRAGMRLDDTSLSRRHAHVEVGTDGVRVRDLGSTNGVLVDGRAVRVADVDTRSTLVIGRTTLRLRRVTGAGLPLAFPGDGTVTVTAAPSPGPATTTARHVDAPTPPVHPPPGRVPWVAALVPLPVALVLAALLGPHLLAFALLGPVMVLGTAVGDRLSGRRQRRTAAAGHERAVGAAREVLATALAAEERERHLAHPDPHVVLRRAERRSAGLWAAAAPVVRLGLGDVAARTTWGEAGHAAPATARGVPVVVDLAETGCLGIVGGEDDAGRLLDWVLGQLCTSLPPGRLHLRPVPGSLRREWWRVPHARGQASTGAVRLGVERAVDVPSEPAAGDRDIRVVLAPDVASLPAACRVRVEPAEPGGHVLVAGDGRRTPFVADGVGPWWADLVARSLAPLRLPAAPGAGPGADGDRLTLGGLLGGDRLTPDRLRAGWEAPDAGPVALVGTTAGGPWTIELARDGPHLLVGGTTGSGKSEFLRTLVTGLATASPPERLALLLVDFKGGAAFGPCAHLPHVVGLVTDLDEHLARRVLTSLRAELRRREQVLAAAGVADVADLGPGPPAVPRLVVVVDEVRALVDELPELVSGLVRIAAQGRSLGIHLVLATQRPAGTVTPEIQANVDLRVSFRVRDRSDSVDVLDAPDAASLAPGAPGLGYARGGDGALTAFRTALVAPDAAPGLEVVDRDRATAAADAPPDRAAETAAVVDDVVAAAAARGVPAPSPPWLPPLPRVVSRSDPGTGAGVVALVDEPDLQRRRSLRWDPAAAPWRVVGRPLTGRTTALRAVAVAAARTCPPDRLHVHVLDASGGLADLVSLPHVGTWCRVDDPEVPAELVAHLEAEVSERRTEVSIRGARPDLLLVVDGWEQLVECDDPRSADPTSERVLRLLRDGSGVGVHGVVGGGRSLLHSRWTALGGTAVLLGRVDALDAVVAGVHERDLPRDPPPGRGVLAGEGRELQIVDTTPADLAATVSGGAGETPGSRPWRHRPLPALVRRLDLGHRHVPGLLLLGAAGPQATGWSWEPAATEGRWLVTGPPRSGRTTTLCTLAESALEDGRSVALLSARTGRRPWPRLPSVALLGSDDVDALASLRRADPRLVVLVDDADRLDDAPVRPLVSEIADLAARDGGAVVVATTTAALTNRFRGLDVETARTGCGLVLSPRPEDGEVLRIRPRPGPARLPGRGVVVTHGQALAVQVLLPQSADAPSSSAS